MSSLKYLSHDIVESLLKEVPKQDINHLVRLTFKAIAGGSAHSPKKYCMPLPGNSSVSMRWINSMPSYLQGDPQLPDIAGMKWVSVCSNNSTQSLPTVNGVMLLNDIDTGIPFAVLDAKVITHTRTAASVSVAAQRFAKPGSKVLTVVGPGSEARYTGLFLLEQFDLDVIYVVSRNAHNFDLFKDFICANSPKEVKVERTLSAKSVMHQTDILLMASTAMSPLVGVDDFKNCNQSDIFVCGLTAFNDLSPNILECADRVIFDDIFQGKKRIEEVSGIHFSDFNLKAEYSMSSNQNLSEQFIGGFNVYLPVGLSVVDLAVAHLVHQQYCLSDSSGHKQMVA